MTHHVLLELVLVLALSVAVAWLFHRIRLPVMVGFILAGLLAGPEVFGLVSETEPIELLAEVGVVLLLFTVGLHLSLRDLWLMKGIVLGAGAAQVLLTGGLAIGIARAFDLPLPQAILWGYLIALSSTGLALRVLEDRGETASPHGRFMVGVLVFQDLAAVPMLATVPLLVGVAGAAADSASYGGGGALTLQLGKSLAVLAGVVVLGRIVFPWLANLVLRTGSREVFTLTTLLVAFGTALAVAEFGLSMALGAFLAGMVVSESDLAEHILSEIEPVRDAFNGMFFVSIGMLVSPTMWRSEGLALLALGLAIVGVKALIAGGLSWPWMRSLRGAALAGIGLAHVGEFSFVVAQTARHSGVLTDEGLTLFLSAAVPTMVIAPLLGTSLASVGFFARAVGREGEPAEPASAGALRDHVIVVGFGINGRNVCRVLELLELEHVIVELNPATARSLREEGRRVILGDAGRDAVLRRAGVTRARALVIAIADAAGSRRIVALARAANPRLRIIVRTRWLREVEMLEQLGADEIVPEEFETSLELAGRVLASYGVPEQIVRREKDEMREAGYGALRAEPRELPPATPLRLLLGETGLERV
ncbi:MAG: cation:proton antiporter, partial [Acidobacteriota bacterium]